MVSDPHTKIVFDRKIIKIHENKIFIQNKLHGQIINSSFVPVQIQFTENEMDSASN